MKKHLFRILGIVLCLSVFLGSLSLFSFLTVHKKSAYYFKPFLQNAGQYDVLFLGNSHMGDGLFPLQLWSEYGVAAYNCSTPRRTIPVSYWNLVNALDYSSPKLVVFDCYNISYPDKIANLSTVHTNLDAFPLSFNKLRAAWDLGSDADGYSQVFDLIFPFSSFHSRWAELTADDFAPPLNVDNGALRAINVADVPPVEAPSAIEPMELDASLPGVVYLRKLIETCASRDISVLLTYLPFPASPEHYQEAAAVRDIAEEYGVNYLNFLETAVVDPATDYYDSFSHLNPSGGQRITAWLGNYIVQNYDLPRHTGDPAYAFLDQRLEESKQYRLRLVAEQSYLSTYLLLLRDEALSSVLHLPAGSALGQDAVGLALMENISIGEKPALLRQAAESGAECLLVVDSAAGQIYEFVGEMPEGLKCSFGSLRFENDRLYIDGAEYAPAVTDSTATVLDCFVFDSASGAHLGIDRSFVPGVDGFVIAY